MLFQSGLYFQNLFWQTIDTTYEDDDQSFLRAIYEHYPAHGYRTYIQPAERFSVHKLLEMYGSARRLYANDCQYYIADILNRRYRRLSGNIQVILKCLNCTNNDICQHCPKNIII